MLSRIIRYITVDIWRIQLARFSRRKSILIRQLRVVLLALRGFDEDKCFLRASSLTFYFLFSIVPVLAMVFGIAKGFGIEKALEAQILTKFQGQQEMIAQIILFSHSLLDQTRGGVVAGLGVALLVWTVVRALSNIENAFNEIWGIQRPRSMGRKFSDYLAILFICPVLLVVAGSATVAATGSVEAILRRIPAISAVAPFVFLMLRLVPYAMIWFLFGFIYSFIPNTRVSPRSAVLGGVVAGTIYQLVQWAYVAFQIGAARYGAIYGSFAAVPLFLAWIQMSWLIVLFGAEISFAHQNVETYEFEGDCLRISHAFKRLVSLRVAHLLVKRFSRGEEALTASRVSHSLGIPTRLANEILYELAEAGVVSETRQDDTKDPAYQPARDPEALTVKSVIDSLEERGSHDIPIEKSAELERIAASLGAFSHAMEKSSGNVLLKSI